MSHAGKRAVPLSLLLPLLLAASSTCAMAQSEWNHGRIALHQGWQLQSACKTGAPGEQISQPGFDATGWHTATVPTTVVAALVADHTFPDPFPGTNLRSLPGSSYPVGEDITTIDFPADSPFRCSWWYRTEIPAGAHSAGKQTWLHLDGINYRANVWVNGHQIADAAHIAGVFRTFEFNVTKEWTAGKNALAIEVSAPNKDDLVLSFWDWNPSPPDKNMGLWKDAYVTTSGPVALRNLFVKPGLNASLDQADLSVSVEARNTSAEKISGALAATVGDAKVTQVVTLAPGESKSITFDAVHFPALRWKRPRLWWPYQMGAQNLYSATVRVTTGGEVSDVASTRFGIRRVTSELTENGSRLFRVNGKKFFVRGGGWAADMLLRQDPKRLRHEFAYVKHMNLNTIRLEGQMETDDFFAVADEQGVMVMAGWMCCVTWQLWETWRPEHHPIAAESERAQLTRLRNHPSMLVWLYASDVPPTKEVEKEYLDVIAQTDWPNPALSSASATPTTITGAPGVKMPGPYDYVPPSYWLDRGANNIQYGGALGFNTETSPGPAIPVVESLQKMLGKDHLWPIDDVWSLHAGSHDFKNLDLYNAAMTKTYGAPRDLNDYQRKSQAMAYDGERAMFEAYGRNRYASTGVIQWMLNNAWPGLIWHLYDYYLQPAGGFYGTKAANQPLHLQFAEVDGRVTLVNFLQKPVRGLQATIEQLDLDLHPLFHKTMRLDAAPDSSQPVITLPPLSAQPAGMYFVRLQLRDSSGTVASSNFYWVSTQRATFDWPNSTYINTPSPQYPDLTALQGLKPISVNARSSVSTIGNESVVRVAVKNPSKSLAFQAQLRVVDAEQHEILPVLWDDNYFTLMPGESRTVTARFDAAEVKPGGLRLEVGGWNINNASLPVEQAGKTQHK